MREVRILLADDHELVRRGLQAILKAQTGWTVVAEAANGREAVEKVRTLKPDICVGHDLDGLLPAARVARATGARLIYHAHELWLDSGGANLGAFAGPAMLHQLVHTGAPLALAACTP